MECLRNKKRALAKEYFTRLAYLKNPYNSPYKYFVEPQQSARYYLAEILIQEKEFSKAASLLKQIVIDTAGKKITLKTSVPLFRKRSRADQNKLLAQRAKQLLTGLRTKLTTD